MPGMADYFEDLIRRRMQKPAGIMPMGDVETEARHSAGLFAKPEQAPQSYPRTMFQEFAAEAAPHLGLIGAPMGMGLSAARVSLPRRFLSSEEMWQRENDLNRIHAELAQRGQMPQATPPSRRYIEPPPFGASQVPLSGAARNFVQPAAPAAPPPRPAPAPGEFGNFMDTNIKEGYRRGGLLEDLADVRTPPRGMLDYEQPIGPVIESPPRRNSGEAYLRVPYQQPGRSPDSYYGVAGSLNAEDHLPTGSAAIASSGLPDIVRGTGAGKTAYTRWIEHAFKRQREAGITDPVVHSDQTLSPFSNRMYAETLKELGYNVTRHPRAYDRGRGQYPHGIDSRHQSGIYQVRPMTPLDEVLPPISLRDRLLLRAGGETPFDVPLGAPKLPRRRRRDD